MLYPNQHEIAPERDLVSMSSSMDHRTTNKDDDDDEIRLNKLGYIQELKRIFGVYTNCCLTSSMVSVILGIIPLYPFELRSGGPVVMFWSWVIIGFLSSALVLSLAEISSAFPTMGALYYYAYRLGKEDWGPFASWMTGWCNLLGQIAGLSSGSYSGAMITCDIIYMLSGLRMSKIGIMGLNFVILVIAGIVNSYSEHLLTSMSYVSAFWQLAGVLLIVIWMLAVTPKLNSASFVFLDDGFNNNTGFTSVPLVVLIGSLAASTTFTGYDTAAHIAEETLVSHVSTPYAMVFAVVHAFFLGLVLIVGMNFCIQDISSLLPSLTDDFALQGHEAYTILWQQTVGDNVTILFLFIVLIAIEFSNCANLTSAARMVYSFSRDGALPWSEVWYNVDPYFGSPVRAIWLSIFLAFLIAVPGCWNDEILGALFSLTATGLYSSYIIPVFLRVTISKDTFEAAEFSLGELSIPIGWFSIIWGLFMIAVLSLPSTYPVTFQDMNYSPFALLLVLIYALISWFASAKYWFKGALSYSGVTDSSEQSHDLATRHGLARGSFTDEERTVLVRQ